MTVAVCFMTILINLTFVRMYWCTLKNFFNLETPEIQQYLRNDWIYNHVVDLCFACSWNEHHFGDKRNERNGPAKRRSARCVRHAIRSSTINRHSSAFRIFLFRRAHHSVCGSSSIGLLILVVSVDFINLSTVHALKARVRSAGEKSSWCRSR